MKVVATGTQKSTEEGQTAHPRVDGDDVKMLDEGNPKLLLQTVADYKADILIAGGRNMYTGLEGADSLLDINQGRNLATQAMKACWSWCASCA